MIPLKRRGILDTSSAKLFSEARKLLTDNHILCDYSIVYRDHIGQAGGMRHLYVRSADYGNACRILHGLTR